MTKNKRAIKLDKNKRTNEGGFKIRREYCSKNNDLIKLEKNVGGFIKDIFIFYSSGCKYLLYIHTRGEKCFKTTNQ